MAVSSRSTPEAKRVRIVPRDLNRTTRATRSASRRLGESGRHLGSVSFVAMAAARENAPEPAVPGKVSHMAQIDPRALVSGDASIGLDVYVWAFTQVREGAIVGDRTSIGSHTYIDADVIIGSDCKIQSGCLIFKGASIEDGVFVGRASSLQMTDTRPPSIRTSPRRTMAIGP